MEQVKAQQPIAILMATYNGERYIKEQLDSLVRQSFPDWHLYIHDDGSTDSTPAIIRQFAQQHSNVTILEYKSQKGAMANFLSLLKKVEANYYMFADQDDIWDERKIEISWKEMEQMESQHPGKPLLVYSDLYVTDPAMHIIGESFWKASDIHPSLLTRFNELAATTPVTGSTMLFNHHAKEVTDFPATHATMHDAWITACVLRHGGFIQAIPQPLVYYRQHEGNVIGATDANRFTLAYRLHHFKEMRNQNSQHYKMLQTLGYGTVAKYIFYKIKYKIRARHLICNKGHN